MDFEKMSLQILRKGEHDEEFENYVQQLLDQGRLEEKAASHGIGKKIVADGVESLTDLQLKTFMRYGLHPDNYVEECERCSEEIPWSEMIDAVTEDGYCSYCRHMMGKDN